MIKALEEGRMMLRGVEGGEEDVGRLRFEVKDDAMKSGTNHLWRLGK